MQPAKVGEHHTRGLADLDQPSFSARHTAYYSRLGEVAQRRGGLTGVGVVPELDVHRLDFTCKWGSDECVPEFAACVRHIRKRSFEFCCGALHSEALIVQRVLTNRLLLH